MNCIFLCIFNKKEYIQLYFLLIESLFIFNTLNNTEILIYTNTEFMNIIKYNHLYTDKIIFEINDNYNNIDTACKSRLDLFNLKNIHKYEKILYLDTDIIINGDINILFDLDISDNKIYVLEEDMFIHPKDFYGKSLCVNDELEKYKDKTAFTSGIILFCNSESIKSLFNIINLDILNRPKKFSCYDQPYIVYNSIKHDMYDNQLIKPYCVNNCIDNNLKYIIHHFPGIPGYYSNKYKQMKFFINKIKDNIIINNISNTIEYIKNKLLTTLFKTNELIESNIFMENNKNVFTNKYILKIKNISNILLNKNIDNVMEIGFNCGFSTLLMLLLNPKINITCFDNCQHLYTLPIYVKLKEEFGDRLNLIVGDSVNTIPRFINNNSTKFDVIHIDGGIYNVIKNDIENSILLCHKNSIIIIENYEIPIVKELWETYVKKFNLKPLCIEIYNPDESFNDIKYITNEIKLN